MVGRLLQPRRRHRHPRRRGQLLPRHAAQTRRWDTAPWIGARNQPTIDRRVQPARHLRRTRANGRQIGDVRSRPPALSTHEGLKRGSRRSRLAVAAARRVPPRGWRELRPARPGRCLGGIGIVAGRRRQCAAQTRHGHRTAESRRGPGLGLPQARRSAAQTGGGRWAAHARNKAGVDVLARRGEAGRGARTRHGRPHAHHGPLVGAIEGLLHQSVEVAEDVVGELTSVGSCQILDGRTNGISDASDIAATPAESRAPAKSRWHPSASKSRANRAADAKIGMQAARWRASQTHAAGEELSGRSDLVGSYRSRVRSRQSSRAWSPDRSTGRRAASAGEDLACGSQSVILLPLVEHGPAGQEARHH